MSGQAPGAVHHVVVVTCEVAAVGVLHLDHAGAEIGEHTRAHRRGHGLFHGDDGDAGERRVHITMPPSTGSTCPVMYDDAFEAMNTNAPAIPDGSAHRF